MAFSFYMLFSPGVAVQNDPHPEKLKNSSKSKQFAAILHIFIISTGV